MRHSFIVLTPTLRFVLAAAMLLSMTGAALAARIIVVTVTVDGKEVLRGQTRDIGGAQPKAVWQYLKKTPLRAAGGKKIEPTAGDPLKANLKGKVEVRIWYGARASTEELHLIRDRKDSDQWRISAKDVDALWKVHKPYVK